MQNTQQAEIVDRVKAEFGVGDNFIQEYFQRWFKTTNISEEQLEKVKNDPLLSAWFHFGISTNQRGRLMAGGIQAHIPKNAKRYLDVGCGYGGFLVAFHEIGLEVTGFELNPDLVLLSQANLKDCGVDPEMATVGNVLDMEFISKLGTFDVITCNDVIEHVNDVELTLKNMTTILKPSGILLMQMPNKDFVNFINNDSHYNLFGITLLRHDEAEKYHHNMFQGEYTVGEYYDYEFYVNQLNKLGCTVQILPTSYPQKTKSEILHDFLRTFKNLFRFWGKSKEPDLSIKLQVTILYLKYIAAFLYKGMLSMIIKKRRETFRRQYMTDFWFIMATKI